MSSEQYFPVVADFKSVVGQSVRGNVTFTPVLRTGDVIQATSLDPRPASLVPQQVTGRIDTDGRLKLRTKPDGVREDAANLAGFPATGIASKYYVAADTGKHYRWNGSGYYEILPYEPVRLLADTPVLELASPLYYQVTFSGIQVGETRAATKVAGFTFAAPNSSDVTINLVQVGRQPGQPPSGITKIAPGAVRVTNDNKLQFSFDGVDIPDAVDLTQIGGAAGSSLLFAETVEDVWDNLGVVPSANLPSYVDDLVEFADVAAFPATGEAGKIYLDLSTGDTYRWSGSTYVRISDRVTASGITDSGAAGRAVVQAATASAVRTAAGATSIGSSLFTAPFASSARSTIGALSSGVRVYAAEFGVTGNNAPSNNVANLMDALDTLWQAGGGELILPPGIIDTSDAVIGTVTANSGRTFQNNGNLIVPDRTTVGNFQISGWTVTGAGRNATRIKLSSGFPYLFHLRQLFDGNLRLFRGITLRDFTVDRNNLIGGSTYGPETNLQGITVPFFTWTTVTPSSGSFDPNVWRNVTAVYFPHDNTGTMRGHYANARWNNGQLQISQRWIPDDLQGIPSSYTIAPGDRIRGALLGAVLFGNAYRGEASYDNVANNDNHAIENLLIKDVDIINAISTAPIVVNGEPWIRKQRNYVAGVDISTSGALANRRITNVRVDGFRMFGGDGGVSVAAYGSNNPWLNDIHYSNSEHDTMIDHVTGYGGVSYNFQIVGGPCGIASATNLIGRRNFDVGLEIDNVAQFVARNVHLYDGWSGFYNNNDKVPALTSAGPPTTTLGGSGLDNSSAQTTATFTLPATVARTGLALVDSELIWYKATNAAGTTHNIWRGINGSTVAAHSASATVTFVEFHKTQFVYENCSVTQSNLVMNATPGQTGVGFLGKQSAIPFPFSPAVFRNCRVTQSGGDFYDATRYWGQFISWDGWRPSTIIEGCRFTVDGIANTSTKTGGGISWNNPGLVANYAAGIPIPPVRIVGRDNMIRISGTTTNASSKYKVLRARSGYGLVDLDMAVDINIAGLTSGNAVIADFDSANGSVALAPGSRVGVVPINVASSDSVPLALDVGPTSTTTIVDTLQLDISPTNLTATGTFIDATQTAKVTIGSSSVGSVRNAPAKGTPADADEIGMLDSANNFSLAKLTFGTIKSAVSAAIGSSSVAPLQTINTQTGSYQLVTGDGSNIVAMNSSSAMNLTVPLNSSVAYAVGTRIDIVQLGTGQVTVVPTSGVTINATPGLKLASQYSTATLLKIGTDTWLLVGSLAA